MTGAPRPLSWMAAVVVLGGALLGACSSDDERGGPDKATFCARVSEFNTGTQAFGLNVADEAEVARIAALLDEIAEAAPEEIRADVEARFAYVDDVVAASQGDDDAMDRLGEVDPTATDEAQLRIDAYAQQECGITLEPAGIPATTIAGVVPPPTVATPPSETTVPTDGSTTVPATTATTETA